LTALSQMHDYDEFKKEVFPKEDERYFIAKPIENEDILKRINTVIANTNWMKSILIHWSPACISCLHRYSVASYESEQA
jgi:hypothetical protein